MLQYIKNRRFFFKEILALLFLLLAVYFFKQQQQEINAAAAILPKAQLPYILLGITLTVAYLFLQGLMYVYAFAAVGAQISVAVASKLFLKRNLISVFLPGGGVTSLAFFTEEITQRNVSKTKVSFASYIFGLIGFASLALVALPVIAFLSFRGQEMSSNLLAIALLFGLLILLAWLSYSFIKKGWIYRSLYRINPQFEVIANEIAEGHIRQSKVWACLVASIFVECTGIFHLYIAMMALGISPNAEAAVAGYIIATLCYAISPFLRGLGAVEISMLLLLQSYGFSNVHALSITLLYRIFEFWLPLFAGVLAFLSARGNIILRLFPGLLLASLGLINIISVLTPPLLYRIHFLQHYIPIDFIHFSNLAVLVLGLLLLACSAFLIKGIKNAWRMALYLSIFSLLGHLFKGIDYEEASLALLSILVLWATRKNYHLKSDPKMQHFGLQASTLLFASGLLYGILGFYFLDKRDFGVDFSMLQATKNSLQSFFLLNPDTVPLTKFAHWFIHSIHFIGVLCIAILVYSFVKPYIFEDKPDEYDRLRAQNLTSRFGDTADDYFKLYKDKAYFFSSNQEGFVAYKIAKGFAIALGEPVSLANDAVKIAIIKEFDAFCYAQGLRSVYYKIDASRLGLFESLRKKAFHIGQEALVDVQAFNLAGKDKKSLRNSLHALEKKGFNICTYDAPLKDGLVQKLHQVSQEWLKAMQRQEIVFSSGLFDEQEIKNQSVITVENADEKVVAFLNIIPSYSPTAGTYDLIRKTADAPAGVMDALIIRLIALFKAQNLQELNMGMAVLSGLDKPKDFPEWTIKIAYEKLGQFKNHHGLFEFKDKYHPLWKNKYLIYDKHYDLLAIPLALGKITKA